MKIQRKNRIWVNFVWFLKWEFHEKIGLKSKNQSHGKNWVFDFWGEVLKSSKKSPESVFFWKLIRSGKKLWLLEKVPFWFWKWNFHLRFGEGTFWRFFPKLEILKNRILRLKSESERSRENWSYRFNLKSGDQIIQPDRK